jgi:hypothetical protein
MFSSKKSASFELQTFIDHCTKLAEGTTNIKIALKPAVNNLREDQLLSLGVELNNLPDQIRDTVSYLVENDQRYRNFKNRRVINKLAVGSFLKPNLSVLESSGFEMLREAVVHKFPIYKSGGAGVFALGTPLGEIYQNLTLHIINYFNADVASAFQKIQYQPIQTLQANISDLPEYDQIPEIREFFEKHIGFSPSAYAVKLYMEDLQWELSRNQESSFFDLICDNLSVQHNKLSDREQVFSEFYHFFDSTFIGHKFHSKANKTEVLSFEMLDEKAMPQKLIDHIDEFLKGEFSPDSDNAIMNFTEAKVNSFIEGLSDPRSEIYAKAYKYFDQVINQAFDRFHSIYKQTKRISERNEGWREEQIKKLQRTIPLGSQIFCVYGNRYENVSELEGLLKQRPDLGLELNDLSRNSLLFPNDLRHLSLSQNGLSYNNQIIDLLKSVDRSSYKLFILGLLDTREFDPYEFFDSLSQNGVFKIASDNPFLHTQVLFIDQEKYSKLEPQQTLNHRIDFTHFLLHWYQTRGISGVYEIEVSRLFVPSKASF